MNSLMAGPPVVYSLKLTDSLPRVRRLESSLIELGSRCVKSHFDVELFQVLSNGYLQSLHSFM